MHAHIDEVIDNYVITALKKARYHAKYVKDKFSPIHEVLYKFKINNVSKFQLRISYIPSDDSIVTIVEFSKNFGAFGINQLTTIFNIIEDVLNEKEEDIKGYFHLK